MWVIMGGGCQQFHTRTVDPKLQNSLQKFLLIYVCDVCVVDFMWWSRTSCGGCYIMPYGASSYWKAYHETCFLGWKRSLPSECLWNIFGLPGKKNVFSKLMCFHWAYFVFAINACIFSLPVLLVARKKCKCTSFFAHASSLVIRSLTV